MSRSQREEKGGKRVKKEQRPSRRGIRWMFLTCCILAIILLALWQTGMLPFPGQTSDPTPPSGITSAEPDTSAPDNSQPDKSDATADQHYRGKKDNSRKIWTVYMFLVWYGVYFGDQAA